LDVFELVRKLISSTIDVQRETLVLPKMFWARSGIENHALKLFFFAPNLVHFKHLAETNEFQPNQLGSGHKS
jgi:hypothetical protein